MGVLHQEQNDGLPNHNFMEDMYQTSMTSNVTPLFELIDERGSMLSGRKGFLLSLTYSFVSISPIPILGWILITTI